MMKTFAIGAFLCVCSFSSAFALTIPSGSVLTTNADGTQSVVGAGETASAQAALEQNGYHFNAGVFTIRIGDADISVNIQNVTDAELAEGMIITAIAEHLGVTPEELDRAIDAQDHTDELISEGVAAVNATGKSVEQIMSEVDLDAATGAIVNVTEEVHQQIQEAFAEIDGELPTEGSAEHAARCGGKQC